ncbi:PREDICTED: filament-like plant protein isoform X2 [Nicotiana attenuata]|uniref:Filament-like plant protein n=1 Tax=Nicotiana attenuata TaxID=49451 RepID=A0A1J6IBI5_NICAT|nr:PREDICTED: filament-like plant protein isoform X2 [Nicotiana attenuata]OIT02389.1 filament-like plant protein [Nicotiana attenuata]
MEKRNWLWKRRPSERSSGETESCGSLSSHSQRHSEEQDALKETPDHDNQSPEVTSKAATIDHEAKESPRKLIEKLSAALVNVSAKEDLVKQHVKVAEEAVAGWEKAENEVAVLKQQLEAAVQQNLTLDVRINHLNGALKECVRQLRQARDEQEQRIQDALEEKKKEWESAKAALENQLLELQTQAEASGTGSPVSTDPDVLVRLECLEKENTVLKLDLCSCSEELQITTIERDLSAQAAETASKQQLESIKKVTKLEAECRRLQALARKSSLLSDQRSFDSHMMRKLETSEREQSCSDSWASALIAELDQFKNEKAMPKTLAAHSMEIDMMDDFLEMERLAAVSETVNKASSLTCDAVAHDFPIEENPLAAKCEAISQRVAELEQKLEKIEAEKAELENALCESEGALKVSDLQLKEAQIKIEELQKELDVVNESKELLEVQLSGMEVEARTMSTNVDSLKTEVERERSLSSALKVSDLQLKEARIKIEELQKELDVVNESKELLEVQLFGMEVEARTMSTNIDSLKTEVERERSLSSALKVSDLQLKEAQIKIEELQKELDVVNESKELLEIQLFGMEVETRTMSTSIDSLKKEVERERSLSSDMETKCHELEIELRRKYQEAELQKASNSNGESKIKQEDLAVAADKLAECQKTIASLGKQLQSLATLEDFLIDTANLPGFSGGGSVVARASGEEWKLHVNETFTSRQNSDTTKFENSSHSVNGNEGESSSSSSSSSTSSATQVITSKSRNGFGKMFSRSKTGIQL